MTTCKRTINHNSSFLIKNCRTFDDKLEEVTLFRTDSPDRMSYQFRFEEDGDGKPDVGFLA